MSRSIAELSPNIARLGEGALGLMPHAVDPAGCGLTEDLERTTPGHKPEELANCILKILFFGAKVLVGAGDVSLVALTQRVCGS